MVNVVFLLFLLDESLGCIMFCSDALVCPYHPIRAASPQPQSSSRRWRWALWPLLGVKQLCPAVHILKVTHDLKEKWGNVAKTAQLHAGWGSLV